MPSSSSSASLSLIDFSPEVTEMIVRHAQEPNVFLSNSQLTTRNMNNDIVDWYSERIDTYYYKSDVTMPAYDIDSGKASLVFANISSFPNYILNVPDDVIRLSLTYTAKRVTINGKNLKHINVYGDGIAIDITGCPKLVAVTGPCKDKIGLVTLIDDNEPDNGYDNGRSIPVHYTSVHDYLPAQPEYPECVRIDNNGCIIDINDEDYMAKYSATLSDLNGSENVNVEDNVNVQVLNVDLNTITNQELNDNHLRAFPNAVYIRIINNRYHDINLLGSKIKYVHISSSVLTFIKLPETVQELRIDNCIMFLTPILTMLTALTHIDIRSLWLPATAAVQEFDFRDCCNMISVSVQLTYHMANMTRDKCDCIPGSGSLGVPNTFCIKNAVALNMILGRSPYLEHIRVIFSMNDFHKCMHDKESNKIKCTLIVDILADNKDVPFPRLKTFSERMVDCSKAIFFIMQPNLEIADLDITDTKHTFTNMPKLKQVSLTHETLYDDEILAQLETIRVIHPVSLTVMLPKLASLREMMMYRYKGIVDVSQAYKLRKLLVCDTNVALLNVSKCMALKSVATHRAKIATVHGPRVSCNEREKGQRVPVSIIDMTE